MVEFIEREFKSILLVRKFIDSWFWERYGINPYNGCQHGCVYCDSRSAKYHLPTDFENTIIVKKNIGQMLHKRLSNARTLLPDVVGMAGTTDPYQSAERKYQNTRQCLEVLLRHRYPVSIATKSGLVLRDLDLLERIARDTWCSVSVTITTVDSEKARFLEFQAPSPDVRFDTIRTIKEKACHIQAGVLLMPVVPCISDSDDELEQLVKRAKEAKADYVLFGAGMTLRDLQAKWFLRHLKERDARLISRYEGLYGFKYNPESYDGSYVPDSKYAISLNQKFFALAEKYNMPYRTKRYIPRDFRKDNYAIAEGLLNEAYKVQALGKTWSNSAWAAQNIQNLKEPILNVIKRGELRNIRNVNEKVEAYIKEYFSSASQTLE